MYYPVEAVGALLSMGDCHGSQGDGESVATGVETSLNGKFRYPPLLLPCPDSAFMGGSMLSYLCSQIGIRQCHCSKVKKAQVAWRLYTAHLCLMSLS